MRSNYAEALKRVLVHEGGYANHPADPGGETMKGVTKRVYDAYRRKRGLGSQNVRYISKTELEDIYRAQYWDVIKGDELPSGVDYAVFDAAVNSGPGQGAKWLQRALDTQRVDGVVGDVTLTKAKAANAVELVGSICDQRMMFLRKLKTWGTFGPGWTRRVNEVRKAALVMAKNAAKPMEPDEPVPSPTPMEPEDTGKGSANDTSVTETPAGNVAKKTGISALMAIILDVFNRFSDTISSFTGLSSEHVKFGLGVALVLVLSAILYFAGLAIYDVLRKKREGEDVEAP
jgi:lysozyme family protein